MIRRFAPVALVAVAVTGAVLAEDAQVQPQGHAQATTPVTLASLPTVLDRPATYDDAVPDGSGVRRAVIMGGLDKITARTVKIIAPVGVTVRFKKLLITPRTCYVRPPEETPETSVFVEVSEPTPQGEGLQRLFSGWMFASSPGLNALEHPVYDVWVVGCHVDDPSNPGAPSSVVSDTEEVPVDQPSIDDSIQNDDAARE
ncbi:hypothetical protein sos41_27230 [Alphaproteobacteria bacterium SO-S41]|nr:hypothetical protein sos41_27230 [Alphaproteobacteria bacterium SO-S41]